MYAIPGDTFRRIFKYGPLAGGAGGIQPNDIPRWRELSTSDMPRPGPGSCISWYHLPALPQPLEYILMLPGNGSDKIHYANVRDSILIWLPGGRLTGNSGYGGSISTFNMPGGASHTACLLGGGEDDACWVSQPITDRFDRYGSTPYPQYIQTACAHGRDGYVYAFFGSTNRAFYRVPMYDDLESGGQGADRIECSSAPDLKVYPEPAAHNVRLEFINGKPGRCAVTIYDIAGRRVCTLCDRLLNAGVHSATWDLIDGHGMRSVPGVYIVQVRTSETVVTRRVTVR
ncbi:MAG: T9SS type A sorting domain-containing protein [candidate division WOR-3 bacterium]